MRRSGRVTAEPDGFGNDSIQHMRRSGRSSAFWRAAVLASQRPRTVDFWTEAVPAPGGWMQLPCAYLQLSGGYGQPAGRASEMGWPMIERASNHFAILTEPALVAADLEALLGRVRVERPR